MRLKNWVRCSLRNTGIVVIASCLLSAYYYVMDDGAADAMNAGILERLGATLLFAMPLCIVIFSMSAYKADIPLAISFGLTRREAFIGLQLMRLIPTVLSVLIATAAMVCGGNANAIQTVSDIVLSAFGLSMICYMLGVVIGIILMRFGNGAVIAAALAVGALTAGTVIAMFALMAAEPDSLPIHTISIVLSVVGVIAYAVVLPFEWHALKTLQVKL